MAQARTSDFWWCMCGRVSFAQTVSPIRCLWCGSWGENLIMLSEVEEAIYRLGGHDAINAMKWQP